MRPESLKPGLWRQAVKDWAGDRVLSLPFAKARVPFRGHVFLLFPISVGARPFAEFKFYSFWECSQGVSLRGSQDVPEPTLSLPAIEWGYGESPADRKATLFSQWSLLANKGQKWPTDSTVQSDSERWSLRRMRLRHHVTQAEKDTRFLGATWWLAVWQFPEMWKALLGWLRGKTSVHLSSVTQSCLTPCIPMDSSTPGFPVHHQLPEFAQSHIHWVVNGQLNHLILCWPLLLTPSIFPSIRVFSDESVLLIG